MDDLPTRPRHGPAGDPEQLIADAQNSRDRHSADDANASDAAFVRQLVAAAHSIKPDPSFDAQLRARLHAVPGANAPVIAAVRQVARGRTSPAAAVAQRRSSERAAWLFAGALVSAGLILLSAITWSVTGSRNGRFAGLPAWRTIALSISLAPPPPGATVEASTRQPIRQVGANAQDTPGALATPTRKPSPAAPGGIPAVGDAGSEPYEMVDQPPPLRATPLLMLR